MKACTFFGHRDITDDVKPFLREAIENLILHHGVEQFYVGNQGVFDRYVRSVLRELCPKYTHVRYYVVLPYMPHPNDDTDFSDTILPERIEEAHPRFAISERNKWMIEQSDYVIAFATRPFGGAAQFAELAEKKVKTVINLAKHFM